MPEVSIWVPESATQRFATNGSRPDMEEIGTPGSRMTAGYLSEQDYNQDLLTPNAYQVYDRMRMSDGQIRAGMMAIKLPILRADYHVEPPSDKPADREVAAFVEDDLFSMKTRLREWLWHVLLALDYGCYPPQIVWEARDDNRFHVRKLAPRHPRSIIKWLVDEHGGFAGIEQQSMSGSGTFKQVT